MLLKDNLNIIPENMATELPNCVMCNCTDFLCNYTDFCVTLCNYTEFCVTD